MALRRRIRPGGAFVWADVFLEPGECRSDYLVGYVARIRREWRVIDDDAREAFVTHVSIYDFPADREAIAAAARRFGWNGQWIWNGSCRAEDVAVLTPEAE